MSLGRVSTLDIYYERDLKNGLITEEIQGRGSFCYELRMVRFLYSRI